MQETYYCSECYTCSSSHPIVASSCLIDKMEKKNNRASKSSCLYASAFSKQAFNNIFEIIIHL